MPHTHTYSPSHGHPLGAHHAEAEGVQQRDEFRELDLHPDTKVEHVATDEETGRPIVAWEDAQGNPRMTSVDPEFFAEHFTQGA